MALIECWECFAQISNHAMVCPHCGAPIRGRKPPPVPKRIKIPIRQLIVPILFVAFIFIMATSKNKKEDNSAKVDDTKSISIGEGIASSTNKNKEKHEEARRKVEELTKKLQKQSKYINGLVPETQKQFLSKITECKASYIFATGELKKSAVRGRRASVLKETLNGSLCIHDWVGTIERIGTTSSGKAYVSIKPRRSIDIHIMTWSSGLSDIGDDTLISQGTVLYKNLSNAKVGDVVIFSGKFIESDLDFIRESSLTEKGSMEEPEFIIKLSSIIKPKIPF